MFDQKVKIEIYFKFIQILLDGPQQQQQQRNAAAQKRKHEDDEHGPHQMQPRMGMG